MSAITQLYMRPADGISIGSAVAVTPKRVSADLVTYASEDANVYDRIVATMGIRQPGKAGDNEKVSIKVKIPVGTAVTDDTTGITTRPFVQFDASFIIPYVASVSEREQVLNACLYDLLMNANGTVGINADVVSAVKDSVLPY